jgi:hypothetical protein
MRQCEYPTTSLSRTIEPSNESPADTRLQVVFGCMYHHRRNRNHAHNPHEADGPSQRQHHVCSQPVVKPCSLISNSATQLLWPNAIVATEPHMPPQIDVGWPKVCVNHRPVLIDSIARCPAAASAGLVL